MLARLKQMVKRISGVRAGSALIQTAVFDRWQRIAFRLGRAMEYRHRVYSYELHTALAGCDHASDISDHLGMIFFFATQARPRLLVELGTRGGASTRSLLAAAAVNDARLLSVDINDCREIGCPYTDRWHFVRADDVAFGREVFADWCGQNQVTPSIDVLFIDTSHVYQHTKEELAAWTPYLSDRAVVMLHDTNMGEGVYGRTDRSVGFGWNNERGVIRAVEEFLDRRYDERHFLYDRTGEFLVLHFPYCNGLTVLQRFKQA